MSLVTGAQGPATSRLPSYRKPAECVSQCRGSQDLARPGIRQLASFAALVSLLVACGQGADAGTSQELYRRLRSMGFLPSCVLAARHVLRAGLEPRLPPDFVDDAVAMLLGSDPSTAGAPGSEADLELRRQALQELFLCIHDTAATDINRLVAACRCLSCHCEAMRPALALSVV